MIELETTRFHDKLEMTGSLDDMIPVHETQYAPLRLVHEALQLIAW